MNVYWLNSILCSYLRMHITGFFPDVFMEKTTPHISDIRPKHLSSRHFGGVGCPVVESNCTPPRVPFLRRRIDECPNADVSSQLKICFVVKRRRGREKREQGGPVIRHRVVNCVHFERSADAGYCAQCGRNNPASPCSVPTALLFKVCWRR